jgi:hypothetical protein
MLQVDQVSRSDPECTADLEHVDAKEGSQYDVSLQEGLRWEVGLKTQGGLLAQRLCR